MSGAPIASLAAAWTAMVANAERSLAAVQRGELRASARQRETWRRVLANDAMLRGRSLRVVPAVDVAADDQPGRRS